LGLRNHLVSLNSRYPGKVHMVAHSMGNVVAGEALALHAEKFGGGPIVNTYVASQAAVPMQCYVTSPEPTFQLSFDYDPLPAISQRLAWTGPLPASWDDSTANVYPSWMATNRAACVARVNFYNPHDFALQIDAWQFNQLIKPDRSLWNSTYFYSTIPKKKIPKPGQFGYTTTIAHLIRLRVQPHFHV
jgi:pimeloyl-ACP methyl ester carboxylesterase